MRAMRSLVSEGGEAPGMGSLEERFPVDGKIGTEAVGMEAKGAERSPRDKDRLSPLADTADNLRSGFEVMYGGRSILAHSQ